MADGKAGGEIRIAVVGSRPEAGPGGRGTTDGVPAEQIHLVLGGIVSRLGPGMSLSGATGGARGPDRDGERSLTALGQGVEPFPADWTTGRGAGFARNTQMARYVAGGEYGGVVLAFARTDEAGRIRTPGTRHMVGEGRTLGLRVEVFAPIPAVVRVGDRPSVRHDQPGDTVYAGRARGSEPENILGNPFPLRNVRDEEERGRVVAAYALYAAARYAADPEFRAAVRALEGRNLACFCHGSGELEGAACHADVLRVLANPDRAGELPRAGMVADAVALLRETPPGDWHTLPELSAQGAADPRARRALEALGTALAARPLGEAREKLATLGDRVAAARSNHDAYLDDIARTMTRGRARERGTGNTPGEAIGDDGAGEASGSRTASQLRFADTPGAGMPGADAPATGARDTDTPDADAPGAAEESVLFGAVADKRNSWLHNMAGGMAFEAEGKHWDTSEAYYQAQKFRGVPGGEEYAERIRRAPAGMAAAQLGRAKDAPPIRADWQTGGRDEAMHLALRAKFAPGTGAAARLLATGDRELAEISQKDRVWGRSADGTGENKLGRMLMGLREELRARGREETGGPPGTAVPGASVPGGAAGGAPARGRSAETPFELGGATWPTAMAYAQAGRFAAGPPREAPEDTRRRRAVTEAIRAQPTPEGAHAISWDPRHAAIACPDGAWPAKALILEAETAQARAMGRPNRAASLERLLGEERDASPPPGADARGRAAGPVRGGDVPFSLDGQTYHTLAAYLQEQRFAGTRADEPAANTERRRILVATIRAQGTPEGAEAIGWDARNRDLSAPDWAWRLQERATAAEEAQRRAAGRDARPAPEATRIEGGARAVAAPAGPPPPERTLGLPGAEEDTKRTQLWRLDKALDAAGVGPPTPGARTPAGERARALEVAAGLVAVVAQQDWTLQGLAGKHIGYREGDETAARIAQLLANPRLLREATRAREAGREDPTAEVLQEVLAEARKTPRLLKAKGLAGAMRALGHRPPERDGEARGQGTPAGDEARTPREGPAVPRLATGEGRAAGDGEPGLALPGGGKAAPGTVLHAVVGIGTDPAAVARWAEESAGRARDGRPVLMVGGPGADAVLAALPGAVGAASTANAAPVASRALFLPDDRSMDAQARVLLSVGSRQEPHLADAGGRPLADSPERPLGGYRAPDDGPVRHIVLGIGRGIGDREIERMRAELCQQLVREAQAGNRVALSMGTPDAARALERAGFGRSWGVGTEVERLPREGGQGPGGSAPERVHAGVQVSLYGDRRGQELSALEWAAQDAGATLPGGARMAVRARGQDILESGAGAIVIPVNTVGVAGKGLAMQWAKEYPEQAEAYREACNRGDLRPGQVLVYEGKELPDSSRQLVVLAVTKNHFRQDSSESLVRSAAVATRTALEERGSPSVDLPLLGAGNGRVDPKESSRIMREVFTGYEGKVTLHVPAGPEVAEQRTAARGNGPTRADAPAGAATSAGATGKEVALAGTSGGPERGGGTRY